LGISIESDGFTLGPGERDAASLHTRAPKAPPHVTTAQRRRKPACRARGACMPGTAGTTTRLTNGGSQKNHSTALNSSIVTMLFRFKGTSTQATT